MVINVLSDRKVNHLLVLLFQKQRYSKQYADYLTGIISEDSHNFHSS